MQCPLNNDDGDERAVEWLAEDGGEIASTLVELPGVALEMAGSLLELIGGLF